MATIAQYIAAINHQRDLLAGHLVSHGIIATADEKLNLLVQKVGLIPSGSSTEKMIVYDENHKEGTCVSFNSVLNYWIHYYIDHTNCSRPVYIMALIRRNYYVTKKLERCYINLR